MNWLNNASFNFIYGEDNGRSYIRRESKVNFDFIKYCWEFLKEDIITTTNAFVDRGKWIRGPTRRS